MNASVLKVSIGLPVYNGEQFIEATLDSILNQSFTSFELIISDNASTDRTQDICLDYAARDKRIRYFRNENNLGASKNFNRVLELSCGEFFKWAGHDDIYRPDYLEKSVSVLNENPQVVLCCAKTNLIDPNGEIIRESNLPINLNETDTKKRFIDLICLHRSFYAQIVFGLMRTNVLRTTRLMGAYLAADLVTVVELSLRGQLYEIPEFLFYRRIHAADSWRGNLSLREDVAWFDPAKRWIVVLPTWTLFGNLIVAIWQSPLSWLQKSYYGMLMPFFWASRLHHWFKDVGWRMWNYYKRQAIVLSKHTNIPIQIWEFFRVMRHTDRLTPLDALYQIKEMDSGMLLSKTARAIVENEKDNRIQSMIIEWLSDPLEDRRMAAASALSIRLEKYGDLLIDRLKVESSPEVRKIIENCFNNSSE